VASPQPAALSIESAGEPAIVAPSFPDWTARSAARGGLDHFEEPGSLGDQRIGDRLLVGIRLEREGAVRVGYVVGQRLGAASADAVPATWTFDDGRSIAFDIATQLVAIDASEGLGTGEDPPVELVHLPCVREPNESLHTLHLLITARSAMAAAEASGRATVQGPPPVRGPRRDDAIARAGIQGLIFLNAISSTVAEMETFEPVRRWATARLVSRSLLAWFPSLSLVYSLDGGDPGAGRRPETGTGARWPAALGEPGRLGLRVSSRGVELTGVHLDLVPPLPPYDLLGGIVRIEVRHPTRPGRRLLVEVLAAERGPAGAVGLPHDPSPAPGP